MYFRKPSIETLSLFESYKSIEPEDDFKEAGCIMDPFHLWGLVLTVSKKKGVGRHAIKTMSTPPLFLTDVIYRDDIIWLRDVAVSFYPFFGAIAVLGPSALSELKIYTKEGSPVFLQNRRGELACIAPLIKPDQSSCQSSTDSQQTRTEEAGQ